MFSWDSGEDLVAEEIDRNPAMPAVAAAVSAAVTVTVPGVAVRINPVGAVPAVAVISRAMPGVTMSRIPVPAIAAVVAVVAAVRVVVMVAVVPVVMFVCGVSARGEERESGDQESKDCESFHEEECYSSGRSGDV